MLYNAKYETYYPGLAPKNDRNSLHRTLSDLAFMVKGLIEFPSAYSNKKQIVDRAYRITRRLKQARTGETDKQYWQRITLRYATGFIRYNGQHQIVDPLAMAVTCREYAQATDLIGSPLGWHKGFRCDYDYDPVKKQLKLGGPYHASNNLWYVDMHQEQAKFNESLLWRIPTTATLEDDIPF